MTKVSLTIILIVLTAKLFAQPGGGGGLQIGAFYNNQLENISSDPLLKIRLFVLADSSYDSNIIQETYLNNYQKLPPSFSHYQSYNYFELSIQRLFIIYKKDTMLIDFHHIMPANGAGIWDSLDSIVFQRGHFRYFLNRKIEQGIYLNDVGYFKADTLPDLNEVYKIHRFGITPFTIDFFTNNVIVLPLGRHSPLLIIRKNVLNEFWNKIKDRVHSNPIIEYKEQINSNFLSEENLPATFYLRRGSHYTAQKEFDLALADIYKSMKMGIKPEERIEALSLLRSIYTQNNEPDKAIGYISDLINIGSQKKYLSEKGTDLVKDNYKARIELLIKKKQLDRALLDYDSLVEISKYEQRYIHNMGYTLEYNPMYYPLNEIIERAEFKMNYLKKPKDAIKDLKGYIDHIQSKEFNEYSTGVSSYKEVYFTLAMAEYAIGKFNLAFKHWLKAEELWYGYGNSTDYVIAHFDTLISKHPKIPELYFSRAIAYYIRGLALNPQDESKICFKESLKDIRLADKSGLSDFRINMYRAMVLNMQKEYEKALEQINMAVYKNDKHPWVFILRYEIRDKLGQVKNRDNKTDTDWLKYTELLKTWKFEK